MTQVGFNPDNVRKDIIQLLSAEENKPYRRSDMAKRLKISTSHRVEYRRLLNNMLKSGEVVRVKKGRIILPKKEELIAGILRGNRRGFGFVTPKDRSVADLYIHRENMSTAMDGDTVLVKVLTNLRRRRGSRVANGPEGEIVEIIERANTHITGTLQKTSDLYYVVPDNLALFNDIYIPRKFLKGAVPNDKVVCSLTRWESKHLNPEGKIIKVLGGSKDFSSEIKAVIERFGLPKGFPRAVHKEVGLLGEEFSDSVLKGRVNYSDKEVFTIDPDTAKDFDDAVSIDYSAKEGIYRLAVHIADVAYYVREGMALDSEAASRRNSFYLTDRVIPMLPEKLSDNLCSLREGVPRLTKTVSMTFSTNGKMAEYNIHDSVIVSRKRFTYGEVLEILEGKRESEYSGTIKKMADLSRILLKKRKERGSVIFDMPEIKIYLDKSGEIEKLEKEGSDPAHSLIEEFMLAANETVAMHLTRNRISTIYRIHGTPEEEKIREFIETASYFGFRLPNNPSHQDIQQLLDKVSGKPYAHIINLSLLRTMKIAEYSAENIGHYGLASKCYLHFTSPIRRYPDLIVHRCLDMMNRKHGDEEKKISIMNKVILDGIASSCSEMEKKAGEAEKTLDEIAVLRYLKKLLEERKTGTYEGIITGIRSYGMSVYIDEFIIEGIIKMSSLVDDYFRVNKKARRLVGLRTRRAYSMGQRIIVRIKNIDLSARELELSPVPVKSKYKKK